MVYISLPDISERRLVFYLAMEEYVARHINEEECFFMWQSKPTVIFGRNQLIENEVNLEYCKQHGIEYEETTEFSERIINQTDILYMTRVQRERFSDLMEYERVKNVYTLTASMLGGCKPNMRVLHPLPRVTEIAQDVDDTPQAYYFEQARNGLYTRQALICRALGI